MSRPAVFLDKDGTLVHDVPYNADPGRVRPVDGAADLVRAVAEAGFAVVVVSNQAGVARGRFPFSALAGIERALRAALAREGASIDAFVACPHAPDGTVAPYAVACSCRKPAPGMLLEAADRLDLDLTASWLVGDILDDIEAGARAGCRTVLLDVGSETEWVTGPWRTPDVVVHDVRGAADAILRAEVLA